MTDTPRHPVSLATHWPFLAPLNIAAYIAWTAILVDVAGHRFASPWGYSLMAIVLMSLLAGIALRHQQRHGAAWIAIAMLALSTLALLWLGRANTTPVLLVIVAVSVALHATRGWLIAIMTALNLVLAAVFVYRWQLREPLQMLLVMGGFQLFALVTVQALRRATEAAETLRQVNADLLATRALLAQGARESERLRLSRELHDVAGHTLTALQLTLNAAQREPEGRGSVHLDKAAALARGLLTDIRAVVAQLRQHDGIALGDLLRALVEQWPQPTVHIDIPDQLRIADIEYAEAMLRVAQESLTNAARHAQARQVWITLRETDDHWQLQIDDDGRGAQDLQVGVGLTGMRERLAALGGHLQLTASARGGLQVTATVPRRGTQ
jgi:signal transduction histidine kinase